jgi:hypothetical protein
MSMVRVSSRSRFCATQNSAYLGSFLNNPPANHDPAKRPKMIQRPLTSSVSSVLVWNLLLGELAIEVGVPSIKSSGCGSRLLLNFNAPRSFGSTRSSAMSRKRLRRLETFGAASDEDSAGCWTRATCSRMGTETESARARSPATRMTLGTCGSSGKVGAASALAREDSQKSGVNG